MDSWMTQPAVHFVGFSGDEYTRARAIFGRPDFIHRWNDPRLVAELVKGDTAVYANGSEMKPKAYSFNDSEVF